MSSTTPENGGKKPKILVIDDTAINLTLIAGILAGDYQLTTVTSGEQGIASLKIHPYDLILLDIMMPVMDGFETLKQLKQLPYFATTPVVFLTALEDSTSEHYGLQLGADDYIIKPFKKELVKLRIRNLLRRAQLQNELELALASAHLGLWDWYLDGNRIAFDHGHGDHLDVPDKQSRPDGVPWQQICHPDSQVIRESALHNYLEGNVDVLDIDLELRNKQGEWVWINLFGKGMEYDDNGRLISLKGIYRNITRRKSLEDAVRRKEEQLRYVLEATEEGVWDWDVTTGIVSHNAAWCRILQLDEKYLVHQVSVFKNLIHPDDSGLVEQSLIACFGDTDTYACEYRMRLGQGDYAWMSDRGKVVQRAADGAPLRMVGAVRDISERKRAEAEIHQLAFYDPLTGLANRRLLLDRLQQVINQNQRKAEFGAIMFLDMDRFKLLNDTLGHDHGDMLLVEISRRLQECVRETDTVARMGGDEFVVLLRSLRGDSSSALAYAQRIGEKIRESLNRPYQLGSHTRTNTPSIGLTIFSGKPETSSAVLKRADEAMYEAKAAGRNCVRVARTEYLQDV